MAEAVNHRNKGAARLILNNEVNYEDSEHTFYLDLPPYSQKDKILKLINDSEKGWPSVDFSFSDGNLKGIENLFTLRLDYVEHGDEEGDMRLVASIEYHLRPVPWKVNEKLNSIILDFARISFLNKLDFATSSDVVHFKETCVISLRDGLLRWNSGVSDKAFLNWNSNYTRIKITINVSKRAEGSVDIVPANPMMTFPNANALLNKVANTRFSEYFLAENLSDCKVEVGGKTFPVHRFVLVEISGFCKRMFSTDMMENRNRVWKIEDFEPEVVEEFLEFAYKGTSKNLTLAQNTEIIMDLFRMGHRYDVVPLKARSEELLKNLINAENVGDLFRFGFLYELESLMAAAKAYFNRFKLQILPDYDAFLDFQKKYPGNIIYKLTIE